MTPSLWFVRKRRRARTLDRAGHLLQAERFEAFLKSIHTPAQPYKEWVVVLWFYIALHYIDAFIATQLRDHHGIHEDRQARMRNYAETRQVDVTDQRLYKYAREARYDGTQFSALDLQQIEPLYVRVRTTMRGVLALPP